MKKILVALAVLVAVAVAFQFMTRTRETREREEAVTRKLVALDERQVHGLRLAVDGMVWALDRSEDGTWSMVRPVADLADGGAVMEFLQLLNRTEAVDAIDDPERLQAYGLEPARAEIRLLGVDVPAVLLGNPTPAGDSVFMQVDGRPEVLVVEVENGSPYLDPDPNRLRDRSLTGMPATEVRQVELRGVADLTLVREGEHWWITSPARLPASGKAMTRFLETLGSAEVVGFLDGERPDDPRYDLGGDAPEITLTGEGAPTTFRLGGGTDAGVRFVYRLDRDLILAVLGDQLFRLPETARDFLDDKLTKANRYKVQWFRYIRDGEALELRRAGEQEGWLDPDGRLWPDDQVLPMLVRLLEAKLDDWKAGSANPAAATLEYEDEGGSRDRVRYGSDGSAVLDSVPGVVFQARIRLPEIPG